MPRVCEKCDGRGLLRHNITTKSGRYMINFIPCTCKKAKQLEGEREMRKLYTDSIQNKAQEKYDSGLNDQQVYKWLLEIGYSEDLSDFIVAKIIRRKK